MKTLVRVCLVCCLSSAFAGETNCVDVKVGADVRLRYDITQGLPTSKRTESPHSDYARIRLRPYAQISWANRLDFYARLADEFRYYRRPESNSRKQQFPDVLFIDNLYLNFKGIADCLDVKVGRQELAYGAKRILSDGTGGDGSRSSYFDAVRLVWHLTEKRTLDGFVLWQAREDYLPTLGKEHANGKKPSHYDVTGYNQAEGGAGLYYQDRTWKDFGFDLYYVAKEEFRGNHAKFRSEGRRAYTHTAGVRLLPRLSDHWSSEVELATQAGNDGLFAGLGYGGITYEAKDAARGCYTLGLLALSGDSEGGRGSHAWHAVFNRETGLGETLAPMYDKYDYTNLIYPHLATSHHIGDWSSLKVQAGPLFAHAQEQDSGAFRGLYIQTKYAIELAKVFTCDYLKGGLFALQGEYFQKGNYFHDGDENPALFVRMELAWKF